MSSGNRSDDQMKCVYMGPPMRRNLLDSLKERLAGKEPKKPYPGSFADDRDPDDGPGTADVHAGPGPDPEEPELEEVYMGPPLTEEPEPESDPAPEPGTLPAPAPEAKAPYDPRITEGVYAGPQIPPMAPVYAGPEMMNDPQKDPRVWDPKKPRMEALYAAPRRPSEMMMVYAGPDYFARKKNAQAPMMLVYAGPPNMPSMAQQMEAARSQAENDQKEAPDYRNETQDPEDLGRPTVCPGCGASVPQSRFCSECGALLPGTLMVKCSCCGSIVRKGKFCMECGAPFTQEESSPEA